MFKPNLGCGGGVSRVSAIMTNPKNGCHFINMHHMEKFQITQPPRVWVSSFPNVDRNGISTSAIMEKWKNGHHFINMHRMEKFQIAQRPPSPQVFVSGLPSESPMCSFTLPDILSSLKTFKGNLCSCEKMITLRMNRRLPLKKSARLLEWAFRTVKGHAESVVAVHSHGWLYYRPQTKFAKVMFLHLSVSHSVHKGKYLGRYIPREGTSKAGTPPGRYTPGRHTPKAGTPPWAGTSPAGRYIPLGG